MRQQVIDIPSRGRKRSYEADNVRLPTIVIEPEACLKQRLNDFGRQATKHDVGLSRAEHLNAAQSGESARQTLRGVVGLARIAQS